MSNLTTKQKIILGGIVCIMLIVIGIYGYQAIEKENEQIDLEEIENIQVINDQNNQIQNDVIEIQENPLNLENNNSRNVESGYQNLEKKIIVHITGAVQNKGILVLSEGSRIADAIDLAGGVTEEADIDEVNLAYILADGQKIYIPNKQDKIRLETKLYVTSGSGNNVIVDGINSEKGENKKVNINTATQTELENLPGVGESIAKRIIEYREQNGKFSKIEDLQNVKGIGDAKFGNIKEYIKVN